MRPVSSPALLSLLTLSRVAVSLLLVHLAGCAAHPAPRRILRVVRPPVQVVRRGPPPLLVKATLGKRFVKAKTLGQVVARIRIQAAPTLANTRPPVNLGLAVDTSGSMAGKAIANARRAARALLGELRTGDRISVVVFHSETQVLVPSTRITDQSRPQVAARIQSMKARGTTDLAGGLSRAIAQVRRGARAGAINRLVLLSDGIPNDPRPIPNLARYASRSAITITALGLGLGYDETLLGALARATGGSFHFIQDPAKVVAVFRREVIRMRQVIAQNLSLRILPGPGVRVLRVYGRSLSRSGRAVYIPLGQLHAGERRDVMVRLATPGRPDGATIELLDGRLTYAARSGAPPRARTFTFLHKLYLSVAATGESKKLTAPMARGFAVSLARAEAAQATVDAIALARRQQLRQAFALLDRALAAARRASKVLRDPALTAQVRQMVKLRAALPALVRRPIRKVGLVGPGHPPYRGRHHLPGHRFAKPTARAPMPVPAPGSDRTIREAHSSATRVLSR